MNLLSKTSFFLTRLQNFHSTRYLILEGIGQKYTPKYENWTEQQHDLTKHPLHVPIRQVQITSITSYDTDYKYSQAHPLRLSHLHKKYAMCGPKEVTQKIENFLENFLNA